MERRAYMLGLYTGQRRGDLVGMTQADRKDGRIRVVQEKTDEPLWIPEMII
jgi:integrase